MPYKKYFSMHVIATLKNYHGNLFVEIGRSSYLRARFPKIDSLPIITMAGVAKFCLQTMMPVLGLSSWSIVSVFRSKLAFIFRLQMIKNNLYKNFWWHKIKLLKCIRQTAKFHLLDNIKQKWPLCYVAVDFELKISSSLIWLNGYTLQMYIWALAHSRPGLPKM